MIEDIDPDDFEPRALEWEVFEDDVAKFIKYKLRTGAFRLDGNHCRVTQRKALYSHARKSDIIFDIAIEVFLSSEDHDPYLIWLWECKKNTSRNVPVDDVEEFWAKMQQVGAHKGTVVSAKGFASGALEFAKDKKIGAIKVNREEVVIFRFSQNSKNSREESIVIESGIDDQGRSVRIDLESYVLGPINQLARDMRHK